MKDIIQEYKYILLYCHCFQPGQGFLQGGERTSNHEDEQNTSCAR